MKNYNISATANFVLYLTELFMNCWRTISKDRFYTDLVLFQTLYDNKIESNSTFMSNKLQFPE